MRISPPWSPSLRQPAPAAQLTPASLCLPPAGSLKNHQEVDMNVVRICFQASYRDQQGQLRRLEPVLSEPVYDKSESKLPYPLGLIVTSTDEQGVIEGFGFSFSTFAQYFFHSLCLSSWTRSEGHHSRHHMCRWAVPPVCLHSLRLVRFCGYSSFLLYFLLSKFAPLNSVHMVH